MNLRILICASALTTIVGCGGTTIPAVAPLPTVPPQAANVGYTTLTYGPNLELGINIFPFDFFGNTPVASQVTQSVPGGAILILGQNGNPYNAGICTAQSATNSQGFTGTVFGGGYYIEAELSFTAGAVSLTPPLTGFPAFWGEDAAHLTNSPVSEIPDPPAPFANYYRFEEPDYMEWLSANTTDSSYTMTLHDWNGAPPAYAQQVASSSLTTYGQLSIGTASFESRNKYGALYVPATATTTGYMQAYFNGAAVGNPVEWVEYNSMETLPPTLGTPANPAGTAFNILDVRQLAILFGTGTNTPMTVWSLTVWQASAAGNSVVSVVPNGSGT